MNTDPTAFNPLATDNEFITNYRKAMEEAYNTGLSQLSNQRTLDHAAIMNQANKAGTMFSNIPQRMKIQYDTNTYMPAQVKLRNTYQTGLDSLRSNAVNAANAVKQYQEMIDYYNTLPTGKNNDPAPTTPEVPDSGIMNSVASAAAALAKGL